MYEDRTGKRGEVRDIDLLQQALGIQRPWRVERAEFDAAAQRLDLHLDFESGGRFECPECGAAGCRAHDTVPKSWRHLNFFQHEAHLHARTPRIECPHCGVRLVAVPWARPGSGFTLLFEAYVLALAKQMPVAAVARLMGENDTRLWRILHHYVEEARAAADVSGVRRVGLDETASRRGHHYITLFVDLGESRLLYATEGRSAAAVAAFRADFETRGGQATQLEEVCLDMSPAYLKGLADAFPDVPVTFDKFHVLKLLNEAVDGVRRSEQRERPELKRSRYVWLKNPDALRQTELALLEGFDPARSHLKTARAYRIKLAFQDFWTLREEVAETYLKRWYFWATHSRLPAIIAAAKTIRRHWAGILRWFTSRISNGVLEGLNSLIQAAKAKARGYRSTRNLITIAYLLAGKLEFHNLPT